MDRNNLLTDPSAFCQELFRKMKRITAVIGKMEYYEFEYSLNNLLPPSGDWEGIPLLSRQKILQQIQSNRFFEEIQIKPVLDGHILLDTRISDLTRMLFVGLVMGKYSTAWVRRHFYFDPRSFNFYVRSVYLTPEIRNHLGGSPYRTFKPKQRAFDALHEVGYQDFMRANAEIDQAFIEAVVKLVKVKGTPILLAIAGPTAAGKTEIVARLRQVFEAACQPIGTIELDNFLLDRDYREENHIGSFGRQALHFEILQHCIGELLSGKVTFTPRYNFIDGTSSHDLSGLLKPGRTPVQIDPADLLFIEGNSPFLMPELAQLVGIKVVYLTDDPVRLKRKWRRDVDYRKKYDPYYLRNRFFKEQPPMAKKNYQPQLLACDLFVETTAAALWVTPQIRAILEG